MNLGRLIRARKFGSNAKSVAYIVAVEDPAEAIDLIKSRAAEPGDEVQDLGRVSDMLVKTLKLMPGEFVRADKQFERRDNSRDNVVQQRRRTDIG